MLETIQYQTTRSLCSSPERSTKSQSKTNQLLENFFNRVCKAFNEPEVNGTPMCVLLLHTCRKGPSLNYFQSLDSEVENNFDAAIEVLSLRFNDTTLQTSLHAELRTCKQSPTESVSEFTNILEKLFSHLDVQDKY